MSGLEEDAPNLERLTIDILREIFNKKLSKAEDDLGKADRDRNMLVHESDLLSVGVIAGVANTELSVATPSTLLLRAVQVTQVVKR